MLSDTVHGAMADERTRDLREEARVERRPKRERTWRNWMRRNGKATDSFVAPLDGVTIRRSHARDREALERLAQLDSRHLADGQLLVAEVAGELRAALPLSGGAAIADPFRPTAPLVSLLQMRAHQIRTVVEGRQNGTAPGAVRAARSAPAGR
jgi:uncharacterized protein YoaH (UPF0181 family)